MSLAPSRARPSSLGAVSLAAASTTTLLPSARMSKFDIMSFDAPYNQFYCVILDTQKWHRRSTFYPYKMNKCLLNYTNERVTELLQGKSIFGESNRFCHQTTETTAFNINARVDQPKTMKSPRVRIGFQQLLTQFLGLLASATNGASRFKRSPFSSNEYCKNGFVCEFLTYYLGSLLNHYIAIFYFYKS